MPLIGTMKHSPPPNHIIGREPIKLINISLSKWSIWINLNEDYGKKSTPIMF